MSKGILLSLSFILAGISFLIMSVGCIKNKWRVYAGGLMFIIAVALFLIGFGDVMFK